MPAIWDSLRSRDFARLRRAARRLPQLLRSVRQNSWRRTLENVAAVLEDMWFDRTFGTETAKYVETEEPESSSDNFEYDPTRIRAFRKVMDRLNLPEDQVFVDFGCGKGRVLIAAAAYPFRAITGVEIAPKICEICRRNIASYARKHPSNVEFAVVQADASEYRVGCDDNVLFFFNPFGPSVMEKVLKNVEYSLKCRPRIIWIIVNKPHELAPAFNAVRGLRWLGEYIYGSSVFWVWVSGSETSARDTHVLKSARS